MDDAVTQEVTNHIFEGSGNAETMSSNDGRKKSRG